MRNLDSAKNEWTHRPEPMAVVPDPRSHRTPADAHERLADGRLVPLGERGDHAREIARNGHLEIPWIACDHMNPDATGFQQRRFVGPRPGAVRRKPEVGRAEQLAPHALGGLCGRQSFPLDRRDHNAVLHTEDEALGANTVAEVLQKGYMLKGKVIRHAMVKVAN
jgi:hypothetical protein